MSTVFTVSMLDELRGPLVAWLAGHGMRMVQPHDLRGTDDYIAVPTALARVIGFDDGAETPPAQG